MVEEFNKYTIGHDDFFVYVNQVCRKTLLSLLDCALL